MPRKVFISFLGTSKYNECEYVKDDFAYRSCFIQEATYRYLTSQEDWSDNDRILILLTQQAEEKNWKDNGHKDRNTGDIIQSRGLNSILQDIAGQTVIETIKGIPEGKDEAEIYSIFEKVYDYLEDGDLLYFDLTHGFRYLPMLILVLGNYAKFLKNVTVKSITYGNWEMSANGTKPAPIIDLLSLSELQDWTFAAGQFVNNGNVKELVRLNSSEFKELLIASKGDDLYARQLRDFIQSLNDVVEQRQTCRGLDIISSKSLKKMRKAERGLDVKNTLFSPIYKKIVEQSTRFHETESVANCFYSAEWCLQNGLFQQAATLLQEFIISHLCEMISRPIDDISSRFAIAGGFNYAYVKAESEYGATSFNPDNYTIEVQRIGTLILYKYNDLIAPFKRLSDLRNDLNHAGMRNTPKPSSSQKIPLLIKDLFKSFSLLIEEHSTQAAFINFSNHPSGLWSDEQISAAKQYGEIIDIPFPAISPEAIKEDLDIISKDAIQQIINSHLPPSTVHIMGEMTLTFALVTELKALGYTCLASTTERKVEINENGDKVVHFEFVQFREY